MTRITDIMHGDQPESTGWLLNSPLAGAGAYCGAACLTYYSSVMNNMKIDNIPKYNKTWHRVHTGAS